MATLFDFLDEREQPAQDAEPAAAAPVHPPAATVSAESLAEMPTAPVVEPGVADPVVSDAAGPDGLEAPELGAPELAAEEPSAPPPQPAPPAADDDLEAAMAVDPWGEDDLAFDFGFNVADEVEVAPAWSADADGADAQDTDVDAGEPTLAAPEVDPLLEGLTPPQRRAALHDKGPLIVTAGPGSGKTRVLTHRVAYLIVRRGVPAWRILAVTFTNKAAGEMRERIHRIVERHDPWGRGGTRVRVSTFHSLCAAMLRRYGPPKRSQDFTIYDSDDQRSLLKRIIKGLELVGTDWRTGDMSARISTLKNQMVTATDNEQQAIGYHDQTFAKIFRRYEEALEGFNALDFDDLLLYFVRLLDERTDVLDELRDRFRYVLVDEYQDTNRPQYLITRKLAGEDGNLFVVGDVDQSIYRWRGADIHNLLDFERDHPSTEEIRLEQNFRSTGMIVRAAQGLIERNLQRRPKTLFTENDDGELIRFVRFLSDSDEARQVGNEIERKINEGAEPAEIAVFYRTNALSRRFEQELRNRGIRHVVVGAVPFYARREVKDILAALRVVRNPDDEQALSRVVGFSAGIGARSFERLRDFARATGVRLVEAMTGAKEVPKLGSRPRKAAIAIGERFQRLRAMPAAPTAPILRAIIDEWGYEARLLAAEDPEERARVDNIYALVDAAAEFDERNPKAGFRGFLDQTALLAATDVDQSVPETVKLMTLHAAKGLEFDDVYIVGLDERLIPLERMAEDCDLEEERRLLYVGITRARKHLTMTSAAERRTYGQVKTAMPSRFLDEIPAEVVTRGGWGTSNRRPVPLRGRSFGGKPRSFDEEFPPDPLPPPAEDQADPDPDAPPQAGQRRTLGGGRRARGVLASMKKGLRERAAAAPTVAIEPGAHVAHHVFGDGLVMSVSGSGIGKRAEIRFDRVGMKTLVLHYARLSLL